MYNSTQRAEGRIFLIPSAGRTRRTLARQENTNMKSLRFLLSVALLAIYPVAFAQSNEHKHGTPSNAQNSENPKSVDKPAPTEAQKSFTQLKDLAGTWQ